MSENPEINGSENPETANAPAPLSLDAYLALSAKERRAYLRERKASGSGPSKVSPRASFVAAAAVWRTDKERREHAIASSPAGRVVVYSGLSKASAGHLFDLGHRTADDVRDLPALVVFDGGAKKKKMVASEKASLVLGAIELLQRLEDAKEAGLPRNHPDRVAVVRALRNVQALEG